MIELLTIDQHDNVAVTFEALKKNEKVSVKGEVLTILAPVDKGHKVAIKHIESGQPIIKYGAPIGHAISDIKPGETVHTQNIKTNLSGKLTYSFDPKSSNITPFAWKHQIPLNIYHRDNGKVGIRNELWVIPTVGCVNGVAKNIVEAFIHDRDVTGVDGIYSFSHPYGCSQLGDDHLRTRSILQNIALHPNAGGVLILGLGCENNQVQQFIESLPEKFDPSRLMFLEAQNEIDEISAGVELLSELYRTASQDQRTEGDWSDIIIGLECGGSDAFSGITANPLIGRVSDYIISNGGSSVLTEVPEMFGAEHILMEQSNNESVFHKTVDMINDYKNYYEAHNQPIYENPSPGNKRGGISTLEEKSLGCTRKAGRSSVIDVVKIDDRITKKGLNLLYSPGNDIVATTSLGAAGCQLVLFSTGRGTPLGGFIPTMKIATNSILAERKSHWIDFNAGVLAEQGIDPDSVLDDFLCHIAKIINGEETSAERRNTREIAIFKTGVTL